MREIDLYAPIKALLESQGYEVKGEVADCDIVARHCDIVARRGDEDPVIVELKTGFSLGLFHQAIERLRLSDAVYVAVPRLATRPFAKTLKANQTLCRRLGLGLMTVRLKDGFVEIHTDPAPYAPRKHKARRQRLLGEFDKLVGDPNTGGMARAMRMTAYRQDALQCLSVLNAHGPTKAARVAALSGVSRARTIMADNHYGWFERVATGIYGPSPKGHQALSDHATDIDKLSRPPQPQS